MRADTARLRWRCRRGSREMDLLLLRFLEQDYPNLDAKEQTLFGALLDEDDPDLYAWVTGQTEPANSDYLPLIGRIKTCLRSDLSNLIKDGDAPLFNDKNVNEQ